MQPAKGLWYADCLAGTRSFRPEEIAAITALSSETRQATEPHQLRPAAIQYYHDGLAYNL